MIRLPEIIWYNGFEYTRVVRKGGKYIYLQNVALGIRYFEAFIPKNRNKEFIKGKFYKRREVFPNNEEIGRIGKSFKRLRDAITWVNKRTGPCISESEAQILISVFEN